MLRKHGRKPWHQSSIYCLIMPSFGLASMRITCHPLRFKANSLVSWLFPFDHGPPFLPRFFCSRQLTADSQELTEIVDFLKAPERFVKVFLLEWCWSSFASKIWFDNTSMKSNVAPGPTMKHMTCLKDFESRSLLTHRPCASLSALDGMSNKCQHYPRWQCRQYINVFWNPLIGT